MVTEPAANIPHTLKHVSCTQRTSFIIDVRTHVENILEQNDTDNGEFIPGKPRFVRVPTSPGLKETFTLPGFQPS